MPLSPKMARYNDSNQPTLQIWLPLFLGLGVICLESTRTMGSAHTELWLGQIVAMFSPENATSGVPELNHILRKSGHFLGYGSLGVLFARVWFARLRHQLPCTWADLRLRAGVLGVASAFLVACADEFHQSYLPGRTATPFDVMLDTAGAVLLNLVFFLVLRVRRQTMIERRSAVPVMRGMVQEQTLLISRRMQKAALQNGRAFLRADSHSHIQSTLDLLHRRIN